MHNSGVQAHSMTEQECRQRTGILMDRKKKTSPMPFLWQCSEAQTATSSTLEMAAWYEELYGPLTLPA